MGCCPVGYSEDVAGGGSTRERGKCGCKTHQAGQGGAQIFLNDNKKWWFISYSIYAISGI